MLRLQILHVIAAIALTTRVMPGLSLAEQWSDASLHHAGLVVQFACGNSLTRCLEFQEGEISRAELLLRSDLRVITEAAGGLGAAICKYRRGWL